MKTKNINERSFSQWTEDELMLYFRLFQQNTNLLLTNWRSADGQFGSDFWSFVFDNKYQVAEY